MQQKDLVVFGVCVAAFGWLALGPGALAQRLILGQE